MIEKYRKYNIILASQSPRRRELLTALDIPFVMAERYDVDETPPEGILALDVADYLSRKKSQEYPYPLGQHDILITSDTLVCIDNTPLGKPESRESAFEMLSMLSGREHTVVTSVTLRDSSRIHTFSQSTIVRFKELSDEEIFYYIDHYSPYDKAGAYAIQEWIGCVAIEYISGSFYNVMGLPVCRLNSELNTFLENKKQ